MAQMVCNNYGNSTIASFEDNEEMDFYRLIAYNVLNIKNNVWFKENHIKNASACCCLTESDEKIRREDCEEKYSFLCKQQSKQSLDQIKKSFDEALLNLKESIRALIEKKIEMNNEKIRSVFLNALSLTEDVDNNTQQSRLTATFFNRFLHISDKIDKCAVPASIKSKLQNGHLSYSEGETVELECIPNGFPTPSISWNGPLNNQLGNESLLKIEHISRFESGFYSCTADNEVGKPSVLQYNIQVHHRPKVTVATNAIETGTGLNVLMTCNVLSNPKPNVKWFKVDSRIEPKRNETTDTLDEFSFMKSINDTYYENKLKFAVTSHFDLGIYKCIANNGIGEDSANVELRGSAPLNGEIINVEQTSLKTLAVNTEFTSYSPISNYKLFLRQIPSKFVWELQFTPNETVFTASNNVYNALFKINNLDMKSTYGIKVIAKNEFGWGNMSDEYVFQPATYVCGENGKVIHNWRYMVSHYAYGVRSFDRYYGCYSTLTSEIDDTIEIEFMEVNVTRRNYYNNDRLSFYDNKGNVSPITSKIVLTTQKYFSLRLLTSDYDQESVGFILRFRNLIR
ncbi:hypothetical protein B4U80_11829, partial [Leptotrombidium deliense]